MATRSETDRIFAHQNHNSNVYGGVKSEEKYASPDTNSIIIYIEKIENKNDMMLEK